MKTPIRARLYLQRVLIGALAVLAALGWLFAVRAGRDLDAYWWHVQWVQRLVQTGQREQTLNRELHQTLGDLFTSLEHCRCEGDLQRRRTLWADFQNLLEARETLAQHTESLYREYERRHPRRPP